MKIIIVGAGIAGLTLALALANFEEQHEIVVLESAPRLAEIGAGVQMTPQVIKYWFAWGMKDDLLKESIIPPKWNVWSGRTGEAIGSIDVEKFEDEYDAPYLVVHRAILHNILHKHALLKNVEVRVDSKVVKYDFEEATVHLATGEALKADLIVASDGINSFARKELFGNDDPEAQPTGWAAYRLTCDKEDLRQHDLTKHLVDGLDSNLWIGEGRSLMTYWIKDAKVLNMVASHRDDVKTDGWNEQQYRRTVERLFEDFEPRARELIRLAGPKIVDYPVYAVPPLKTWTHNSGRCVLVGDAAHAMAFWLSMGVSLACEDGVALATVLDLVCEQNKNPTNKQLVEALKVFEAVRKPRAESVQKASLHAGVVIHMPDGPEAKIRDQALRLNGSSNGDWLSESERVHVYGVADKKIRGWCYGHDVIDAVRKEWTRTRMDRSSEG